MKIMVASDIHGSAKYCEQMLAAFRREKAEILLLLGDLLYHGPRNDLPEGYDPKAVIRMLNEAKEEIFAVRGNCDAEVDQMVLAFPIVSMQAVLYVNGKKCFAVHGHRENGENPPPLPKGAILFQGHTHIPGYGKKEGYLWMNPGSVAIPKQQSPHSYLIMEEEAATWKNLEGEPFLRLDLS